MIGAAFAVIFTRQYVSDLAALLVQALLPTTLSCHVAAKQAARLEAVAERFASGKAAVRDPSWCQHGSWQALCRQTESHAA